MDQKQHQLFRSQLLNQREQIEARGETHFREAIPPDLSSLTSELVAGIPDDGSSECDLLLLQKIGLALVRLEEGIYEQCARCGGRISLEQLLANPATSLCLACVEAKNAEGGRSGSPYPGRHPSSA